MKSSPRSIDMASSTGSKTPASGKKLVQARLPFKTLGGSEPPVAATNDASNTNIITANALNPDNRKRKQNSSASKEDGIRAAKLNRCEQNDDVCLETTEAMELSNDTPASEEKDSDAKPLSRKSESKENVCVDENSADDTIPAENANETADEDESAAHSPKAKQSLDFEEKRTELRKSKKASESGLITIKLPLTKKAKAAIKKGKKPKQSESDVQTKEEEAPPPHTEVCDEPTKMDASLTTMEEDEPDYNESMDDENLNDSTMNDSAVLDVSEHSSTPASHKLTPKQIEKRVESEKKKQEKERVRIERERKLQEERNKRELQKKREREEKGKRNIDNGS